MNPNYHKHRVFLKNILKHTDHTIASLSEILDIPKKKLMSVDKLSRRNSVKIDELWDMLEKANWPWINKDSVD